jgi:hypothetical protein
MYVTNMFLLHQAMTTNESVDRPLSRRERPAKPALTREGFVGAALTILEEEGLGTVTMRRIAASLDTGAASLYVYVRDTEDLQAGVLDALIGAVAPAGAEGRGGSACTVCCRATPGSCSTIRRSRG